MQRCTALIAQADERHLSDDPTWRHLLHYTASVLSGVRSQARSPTFFVSPRGAERPREELVAMLEAVCPALLGDSAHATALAVRCRFPARYDFLAQRLVPASSQPTTAQACPEFAAWQQRLNTQSVSLVFAAGEMQRPSTLFGHTFLRLESGDPLASELLAHAVSFTVAPSEHSRRAFVAQALVGSLDAIFDVAPYYRHVQRYSDLQSRDLWTYHLNLSAEALARLVAHLWELRHTRFAYRFFDTNCASALLELLDLAVPDARLAAQLGLYAIPIDAVQIIGRNSRLSAQADIRPALATRAQTLMAGLSHDAWATAQKLANVDKQDAWTDYAALADAEKRSSLQAADMLLRLQYGNNVLADARGKSNLAAARMQTILSATVKQPCVCAPDDTIRRLGAPHRGHPVARMTTGIALEGAAVWSQLSLRAALHDLLDAPAGYGPWAALEVMHLQLRLLQTPAQMRGAPVQLGLDLLRMTALRPWLPWAKPVSWRGALVLVPSGDANASRLWASSLAPLRAQLELGVGLTASPLGSRAQAYYVFVDTMLRAELGDAAQHLWRVQASVGGVWRWEPRWSAQAELLWPWDVWGPHTIDARGPARPELKAGVQLTLSPRFALRARTSASLTHRAGSVLALFYF